MHLCKLYGNLCSGCFRGSILVLVPTQILSCIALFLSLGGNIFIKLYGSGGRYTRYDEPDDGDGGFNSFGFSGGNENILLSKAL